MPKPTCLQEWASTPGKKLSLQDGGCSPFCHVALPEKNEDGTYGICGARYEQVGRTAGATVLRGRCLLDEAAAAEPDTMSTDDVFASPVLVPAEAERL